MGIERDRFVGNPHKQEYVDEDTEELENFIDDENVFVPLFFQAGDPDLLLDHDYDIITDYNDDDDDDDDDENYDPEHDYEDFLSDCDYDYAVSSDESRSEADFMFVASIPETGEEVTVEESSVDNQETGNDDSKSLENKTSKETKPSEIANTSSNGTDNT